MIYSAHFFSLEKIYEIKCPKNILDFVNYKEVQGEKQPCALLFFTAPFTNSIYRFYNNFCISNQTKLDFPALKIIKPNFYAQRIEMFTHT